MERETIMSRHPLAASGLMTAREITDTEKVQEISAWLLIQGQDRWWTLRIIHQAQSWLADDTSTCCLSVVLEELGVVVIIVTLAWFLHWDALQSQDQKLLPHSHPLSLPRRRESPVIGRLPCYLTDVSDGKAQAPQLRRGTHLFWMSNRRYKCCHVAARWWRPT